jgi:hypothetical protein
MSTDDERPTPLTKAAEKVIAVSQDYPNWTPAEQKHFLTQHREDLAKLELVARGALSCQTELLIQEVKADKGDAQTQRLRRWASLLPEHFTHWQAETVFGLNNAKTGHRLRQLRAAGLVNRIGYSWYRTDRRGA